MTSSRLKPDVQQEFAYAEAGIIVGRSWPSSASCAGRTSIGAAGDVTLDEVELVLI